MIDRRLHQGSSPLARGLLTHFDQGTSDHGIIPARAGFTITSRRRTPGLWDHPRSRGVYCSPQCRGAASAGSSPLARGLRDRPHEAGEGGRIIPARAGFTGRFRCCRSRRPDHPRSRGVYLSACPPSRADRGSSPLARGLLAVPIVFDDALGIIPARAGFTVKSPVQGIGTSDHPRSRGVYINGMLSAKRPIGSSPLARGLRHASHHQDQSGRIIPARAGFTQSAITHWRV